MIEMKINTEEGRIQVKVAEGSYLELVDSWNNRKVLMIMLRLIKGEDGKAVMTFEEIAKALGYSDRRNVNNFWREFCQCGMDFSQYLRRKYKIEEKIRDCILEVFLEDIFATAEQVTLQVQRRLKLEAKDLSSGTVRNVLGDILKVRAKINKMLARGQAHIREEFLIEELFAMVDQLLQGCQDESARIKQKHLQGQFTRSELCPQKADVKHNQVFEAELMKKDGHVAGWVHEYMLMFLLYWHGISLSTLGKWFSVDKSTVWRRLRNFSYLGFLVLSLGVGISSGLIGVDEKWIRVSGRWQYLFFALDLESGLPLHFEIYKSRSNYYCRLFMTRLRQLGYSPRLIVTDGLAAYAYAIRKVFPGAQHQLCIFHLMQSITLWLKKHIGNQDLLVELKGKAKRILQTADKRTARRRLKKLKKRRKIKGLLVIISRKWGRIIPAIGSTWIPSTNNSTERFIRAFERFYRARQAFHDKASASEQVRLFLLGYLIEQQVGSRQSPLEQLNADIRNWPLYKMWNKPDFSKLQIHQSQQGEKAA